jgi:hypothetical protein
MRDIKILNKNYEVANLYTVVYEGYTIKEIIEDTPVFSVTPPQHYLDYWQKIYDYLKSGTKVAGHTYLPQGQSKYDVAYVNKTIDDPIAELNGHTLREVFENTEYSFTRTAVAVGAYISLNNPSLIVKNDNDVIYIRVQYDLDKETNGLGFYLVASPTIANRMVFSPLLKNQIYSFKENTGDYPKFNLYGVILENDVEYTLVANGNQVNLTTLGIDSSIDMDYYYSLYKTRENISKKSLTYADIFEDKNLLNGLSPTYIRLTNQSYADGILTYEADSTLGEHYVDFQLNGKGIKPNDYLYHYTNVLENNARHNMVAYYWNGTSFSSVQGGSTINVGLRTLFNQARENYIEGQSILWRQQVLKADGTFTFTGSGERNSVNNQGVINANNFDELITKEQLDTMLAHYLLVKNIVIYPEIYVPTDPTGFGNRYAFLELNKKVYGHELDFENMQVNLLFGVYKNAYDSYNQLMNFIINNEGIIAYDYGKGVRYTDIRLIKSPKTELDDGQYLKEKFDFKRLSPFYTLEQGSSLTIKNIHDWDIKPIVSGNVNTNIVYIEAEEITSGLLKAVKFDFTALTKPFDFYYNAETKQILINGINNGYQYIDFSFGISFISLPKDSEYVIWTTGITSPTVKAKKWVID